MLTPETWETLIQENLALTWMANDVKIIGSNGSFVLLKLDLFQKLSPSLLASSSSRAFS